MRVRLFAGERWQGAEMVGDVTVDAVPVVGDKLAIAGEGAWQVATVTEIAHRIADMDDAADIALLLTPLIAGGSLDEPLPLAALDGEADPSAAPSPSRGPWG